MFHTNKIISISGTRREDIVYYLSKMLATCDKPILCVDNSEQLGVFNSVSPDSDEPDMYVRNVVFVKNAMYSEKFVAPFEYVVVYHGMHVDETWWNAADIHFVVTNYNRMDVHDIREELDRVRHNNLALIFTERFSTNIKDPYIIAALGLLPDDIALLMEVPIDTDIENARLILQHNGSMKVAQVPKTMKTFLKEMYEYIVPGTDTKQIKQIINSAG